MSASYRAVQWTPHKKRYDLVLLAAVLSYLVIFVAVGMLSHPQTTIETQLIRALGTCSFLMLYVILLIGPLARLDPRFLPLLYNRRHFGVAMFLVAAAHGVFSIVQFHALGDINPLFSVLVSGTESMPSIVWLPFQPFGFLALVILFVMAATSHDFWLVNLTAPVWKALHMSVYLAWVLLVLHVALGGLQSERSVFYAFLVAAGVALVTGLHVVAALRERSGAATANRSPDDQGFVAVAKVSEIAEDRAITVELSGERVAVFRYNGKISAISNVCRHQNGPLGEGKIVDGCITCPWHGWQYRPEDGASPPPFDESVPTFRVRLLGDQVLAHPTPLPAGTHVEPATIEGEALQGPPGEAFFIGWSADIPSDIGRFTRSAVLAITTLGVALAVILPLLQNRFDPGSFDFGNTTVVEGELVTEPYPALHTDDLDSTSDPLLVATGKRGAEGLLAALESGSWVEVEGTKIDAPAATMIEITRAAPADSPRTVQSANSIDFGEFELAGEIVDSKCFLGVMKPGRSRGHRACAIRCISGGVPPALLVTSKDKTLLLLLADQNGKRVAAATAAPLAAQPLTIRGRVGLRNGHLTLESDPLTWALLD